jgi:hypothetical protein
MLVCAHQFNVNSSKVALFQVVVHIITPRTTRNIVNKELKIPKGHSKSANRRTQWPKDKGQTTFFKTLHIKPKIEQREPH